MAEATLGVVGPAINPAVVIGICFAVAALEGYDIQALGVAAPALARALRLARDTVGFAGSAAMLGLVIGAVFGGWLADRIGRRPVLVAAVVWFGVFSLVTALASDANGLMLARLAVGLGFGGAMPNMIAIAAEVSARDRRVATVTTMLVGLPTGGAAAALVSRFAPQGFDWRLIFIIGGLAPLAVAPLAWWLLPETRPDRVAGEGRWLATVFGGGRAASTLLLWVAYGFTLATQFVMLSWLPTLAIGKGLSVSAAALAAVYYNLAGIGGGLSLGLLVDRFGPRWPLAATYLGTALAMAALAAAVGVVPIVAFSALCGFLMMGGLFSIYAMAPSLYPAHARATGTGAAVGVGRLGSIAGPSIGGLLLTGGATATEVIAFVVPMIVVAGMAAVLLAIVGKPAPE